MTILRIQPRDCSPLGREVLRYMKEHQVSMNALAKQVGISQPSLRSICLGHTSPTTSTLRKLAGVLQQHPLQLHLLVFEHDEESPDAVDQVIKVLETTAKKLKSQGLSTVR